QTQYGVLYTPFLGDLAEVLATAGRLDDSLAAANACSILFTWTDVRPSVSASSVYVAGSRIA
ncbi:MAG: hypothetical protein WA709_36510, partial [Stellaceae bacterium]